MSDSKLLTDTVALLNNRAISLREISEQTGINYWWLRKFQQGVFEDPGVQKIERLHNYLKDKANSLQPAVSQ